MSGHPYVMRMSPSSPKRFALLDRAGQLVTEAVLAHVRPFAANGSGGWVAAASTVDGGWGYLGESGQWLSEPHFTDARTHSAEGLARIQRDERWGYVNLSGEVVIEPVWSRAAAFSEGLAAVNGGYINTAGELVLTTTASGRFSPAGLAAANGGYIDRTGALVIERRFDETRAFSSHGAAPVRVGKLWGLIDTTGAWIVEPRYENIEPFNDDGLAFYSEPDSWWKGHGYLDSTGTVVVKGERHLSRHMSCGLARSDLSSLSFVGRQRLSGRYDWAGHFDRCGATLARQDEQWGVLRSDGRFLSVPYAEPATDDDGWVTGFGVGQGIAPFLAGDGSWHYVDVNAGLVYRLEHPNPSRAWLTHVPEGNDDVVAAAEALQTMPPQRFYPSSLVFGEPDEDEDDDEYLTGVMTVLAEDYVGEDQWGCYHFLSEQRSGGYGRQFEKLEALLSGHYGAPEHDTLFLRHGDTSISRVWTVNGKRLVLQLFSTSGDGDFEHQIWLAVVPGE